MPAPGVVLALDLATNTGWCVGRPGERPHFGEWDLYVKGSHGARFAALHDRLCDAIQVHQPKEIIFEAALPRGSNQKGVNAGRLLLGFCAVVELVAFDHRIPALEEPVQSTRKVVLGKGTFPKDEAKPHVARWCVANGFGDPGPDAADALVLWKHVEILRLGLQPPPGGLFEIRA